MVFLWPRFSWRFAVHLKPILPGDGKFIYYPQVLLYSFNNTKSPLHPSLERNGRLCCVTRLISCPSWCPFCYSTNCLHIKFRSLTNLALWFSFWCSRILHFCFPFSANCLMLNNFIFSFSRNFKLLDARNTNFMQKFTCDEEELKASVCLEYCFN